MLSIGKLATGQADYYLQQAGGRVDRTTSIASGVEDYYTGGPEAAGEWPGVDGAASLGLSGPVGDRELRAVLEAAIRRPATSYGIAGELGSPVSTMWVEAPRSERMRGGLGSRKAGTRRVPT